MIKMRRFTAYVAGSTALTVSVVAYALIDRPNFYSAAVYLSQSNACALVLTNFCLLAWFLFVWALQRLFFGHLRALEIEALSERGWIVATEWLFAMSTFRGDFGVETAMLFLLLIVGKAWGWICEGRIDTLDHQAQQQQLQAGALGGRASPPRFAWVRNQGRLMSAVALNLYFSLKILWYCTEEVMLLAKPGVMMMFVFEWAILFMNATHLAFKYAAWGIEQAVLKKQQKERIEELRREAVAAAAAENDGQEPVVIDRIPEEDLDVHDLDLPGWEGKGKFLFGLDIIIDSLKVIAYLAFFAVLTRFYGLPFYILRDLYLSIRSLSKRLNDFLKYQKATANMNSRYPDATAEELSEDNTCIICREEMHPWHETAISNVQGTQEGQPEQRSSQQYSTSDRQRPKKLPCGHILHFYCLRSWLERQQTCPTCRRSVLDQQGSTTGVNRANGAAQQPNNNHHHHHQPAAAPNQRNANLNGQGAGQNGNNNANNAQQRQPGRGLFQLRFPDVFNFRMDENLRNRLRAVFNNAGAVPPPMAQPVAGVQQPPAAMGETEGLPQGQTTNLAGASGETNVNGSTLGLPTQSQTQATTSALPLPHPAMEPLRPQLQSHIVHTQLAAIEAHLNMEMQSLQIAAQRATILHQMQAELDRLRQMQTNLEARTMQVAMQIPQSGRSIDSQNAHLQPNIYGIQSLDGAFRLPPGFRLLPLGNPVGTGPQQHQTQHGEPRTSSSTEVPPTAGQALAGNQPASGVSSQPSSSQDQVTHPIPTGEPNPLAAYLAQVSNQTPTNGAFPAIPTPPPQSRSPFQHFQFGQPVGQQQQHFVVNPGQMLQPGTPTGYNVNWVPTGGQGAAQPTAANNIPNTLMDHQVRQRQQFQDISGLQRLVQQAALAMSQNAESADTATDTALEGQNGNTSTAPNIEVAVPLNPAGINPTAWTAVEGASDLSHSSEVNLPVGAGGSVQAPIMDNSTAQARTETGVPLISLTGDTSASGEPAGTTILGNLQPNWQWDASEPSSNSNQSNDHDSGRHTESGDHLVENATESTSSKGKGKERLVSNGSAGSSSIPPPASLNATVEDVHDEDE